ncbi:MAG: 6,7-dimethyl-8-ribityllumazine synthase [Cytophagales bacterium]|nr:6,7-dimethyl-8-ribityllumazine synthase [Cytophagales bacterium]
MATPLKDHDRPLSGKLIDISEKKFALVVSSWNKEVTELLYSGAYDVLIRHGAKKTNIIRKNVPGSFELSLGGQWTAQSDQIDAVICLGCIIQGETRHFEFICNAVSYGLTKVGLKYNKPVIFGVLTTNNLQQAMDRAGKKYGNKGEEAALSAIKMLGF